MYASEAVQHQYQQQQKRQRGSCFPTCKTPDKRDFMDSDPPRTTDDFYRHYDPWIGIGTAIILALFFILIAFKTFMTWFIRRITIWRYRYQKYREKSKMDSNLINHTTESIAMTTQIADNGHIIVS
uniref:Movement protein n=1 Tax=Elaeophora elaphi TaxID=1147741 RepID=A0A0R3RJT5_9BILA